MVDPSYAHLKRLIIPGEITKFAFSIAHDRGDGCDFHHTSMALFIPDRGVLSLLGQYMKRTSERGGWFHDHDHDHGISLGCPLSPLMAAFYFSTN
jgi:hypothetical protein